MEDQCVAAIGVDQPIFGAPAQARDPRPGQPLAQIGLERPAQVRPAQLDRRDPSPLEQGGEPANRGFDLGKLRHCG
jgi:hypothetical protein